jgi:hypothetical protein
MMMPPFSSLGSMAPGQNCFGPIDEKAEFDFDHDTEYAKGMKEEEEPHYTGRSRRLQADF